MADVQQYIGARYVPLFATPLQWDINTTYEPLTIVLYQGASYTSRQAVPEGIDITNDQYWALTGNYNAQVEQYRQEVRSFNQRIIENTNNIKVNADNLTAEMTARKNGDDLLQEQIDYIVSVTNFPTQEISPFQIGVLRKPTGAYGGATNAVTGLYAEGMCVTPTKAIGWQAPANYANKGTFVYWELPEPEAVHTKPAQTVGWGASLCYDPSTGNIIVVDTENSKYDIYSSDLDFIRSITPNNFRIHVYIDKITGKRYISDRAQIAEVDDDYNIIKDYAFNLKLGDITLQDFAVYDGILYVVTSQGVFKGVFGAGLINWLTYYPVPQFSANAIRGEFEGIDFSEKGDMYLYDEWWCYWSNSYHFSRLFVLPRDEAQAYQYNTGFGVRSHLVAPNTCNLAGYQKPYYGVRKIQVPTIEEAIQYCLLNNQKVIECDEACDFSGTVVTLTDSDGWTIYGKDVDNRLTLGGLYFTGNLALGYITFNNLNKLSTCLTSYHGVLIYTYVNFAESSTSPNKVFISGEALNARTDIVRSITEE